VLEVMKSDCHTDDFDDIAEVSRTVERMQAEQQEPQQKKVKYYACDRI
ncbi:unnamed protein product, partial [uncultured virus]